jgi:predicted acyltransferase
MDNNQTPDLRDTAHNIAVRAGVLTVGGILIGGWMTALAMKVASRAIHLLLVVGLGLIVTGFGWYEVKKVQRRWDHDDVTAQL